MACGKFIQEYPDYFRACNYIQSGKFDFSNDKDMNSDAREIIEFTEGLYERSLSAIRNYIEDGIYRSDVNPVVVLILNSIIAEGLLNISPFQRKFMETRGITMQQLYLEISDLVIRMVVNTGEKGEDIHARTLKWMGDRYMQQTKIKVNLSGIPQTSLLTLYGRAKISKENGSLFNDAKAIELVERIDYDFSAIEKSAVDYILFATVARAMQFDDKVKAYVKEHPRASVVNLGAGFDTGFFRVDNSTIRWYDLDLPEVIEVRKQLLPETGRATCIAKSFLDPSWCQDIKTKDGVFMIAGGLFRYFDEAQVSHFFSLLVDHFPGSEIVFEADSKLSSVVDGGYGAYGAGWSDSEPDKRDAMQAELFKSFKNGWMITPQGLKDKMIGALTTQTKPQSTEWADFELWWNQLSAQEKGKSMGDFAASYNFTCGCPLDDANEMTTWDDRIIVVDQFPLFRNIPRDSLLSRSIRQFMDYTDEKGRIKIIHLRV